MEVTYFDIKDITTKTITAKKVVVGAEWVTIFKKESPSFVIQIENLLCIMEE